MKNTEQQYTGRSTETHKEQRNKEVQKISKGKKYN